MTWPYAMLLTLLGVFLLRFAMANVGGLRRAQNAAALVCFGTALWAWQVYGWAPWFGLLAFFLLIILPIVEIVLAKYLNKSDKYWV